jgi:hypothetical protein
MSRALAAIEALGMLVQALGLTPRGPFRCVHVSGFGFPHGAREWAAVGARDGPPGGRRGWTRTVLW